MPPQTQNVPQRITRRFARHFALELRECVDFGAIREHLVEIALGKDPATGEAAPLPAQIRAAEVLLAYAFGQPVQQVALDASLRAEQAPPAVARPPRSIEEVRARIAQLVAAGVRPRVIDVDSAPALPAQTPDASDDRQ